MRLFVSFFALLFFASFITIGQRERVELAPNPYADFVDRKLAKFEPQGEGVLVFVGQEMEAIGGLEAPYNDGYLDHFRKPAGFTMYTNFSPGDESFGYTLKGLDGVFTTDNWGDENSNMSKQIADPDFGNMALAIGLWFTNHEEEVATGELDHLIEKLGDWFKSLGNRPVFLRIGYEFDGHAWNNYDRENYLIAYKRIKDKLDEMGVENVAYVWQSTGWVSDLHQLWAWYPGDEYVDWCGASFFNRWKEIQMYEFARQRGKPVFLAEASPTVSDYNAKFTGDTKPMDLKKPADADEAWMRWFMPFFREIERNRDVVKAINYINCNWKSHPMWVENPTFKRVDARLQINIMIKEKWNQLMDDPLFIHSSEDLYRRLWRR